MKIAMIGHKDFPSRSGGVEVVVYELSTRLAEKGVDVTVYNRGKIKGKKSRDKAEGVNIIRSATFKKQSLNAMVYSFTATFNALFKNYDIIHYHAIGICVPLFLAHIFGKKTVATVHGLNWKVDKWNSFAAKYLKLGEKTAAKYADEVVTLSDEMHDYFLETYGRETVQIKNAVSPVKTTDDTIIKNKFGIEKNSYIFYVGRISPEKGVLDLISAYNQLNISQKLVISGEIPDNSFGEQIKNASANNKNIIFTGFCQGELLDSLYSNCALYVLPSHTEGLSLSLLEAMSCGAKCLVSNIVENTSVLNDFGFSFESGNIDDLADSIIKTLNINKTDDEIQKEISFVKNNYNYDLCVEKYLEVYKKILNK